MSHFNRSKQRALVLGGGGVVGIAWGIGVVVGLADEGVHVRNADLFIGTSAGANAAVMLTSSLTLEELFQSQIEPEPATFPLPRSLKEVLTETARVREGASNPKEARQRIGAWALANPTATEAELRQRVEARLPIHTWPQSRLALIAVDAESGERVAFERSRGIRLDEAVMASSALPGIWPPLVIDGHRYIDGGVYTFENADLAVGFERVLVLSFVSAPFPGAGLDHQIEVLRQSGSQVEAITPDAKLKAVLASVSGNPLDPSVRAPAAHAGREQGRSLAHQVAALWMEEIP